MTSITYPGDPTVTLTYDSSGNLASVIDPMDNLTEYEYDSNGNLTSITDPLTRVTILKKGCCSFDSVRRKLCLYFYRALGIPMAEIARQVGVGTTGVAMALKEINTKT